MVAPLLDVRNLELSYGRQKVVNDVSFHLSSGRILALIGPNGAGKSSIMRILAGLVRPEKGQLILQGKLLPSPEAIHQEAGFFIEGPDFYTHLNAQQNLMLLKKIRNAEQSVDELLQLVGLEHAATKKVRKFSSGMKQRLGIAQALLGNPSMLVLDEPFNGLDPEVKQEMMDLIRKLSEEENKAIMVSSHILSDLETLADDFVLLSEGRVQLAGVLSDFKKERHRVRFWFAEEPPVRLLEKTVAGSFTAADPWCWETQLTIPETSELVRTWAADGCVPFEIQRADLLQSKYLEMIQ